MTCVSVIGRNTIGKTIVGDFELTGAAAGAAIALFLPWCQLRRGNIIVDFFTAKASERTNALLDRIGALLFALALGLMAWAPPSGALTAGRRRPGPRRVAFPGGTPSGQLVRPLC